MIQSALIPKCSAAVSRRTPTLRSTFPKRTNRPLQPTRRPLPALYAKRRTEERAPTPLAETTVEEIQKEVAAVEEEPAPVQPQYYQSYPAAPPQFPIQPPPHAPESTSGLPPWVWIMVGVLLATVFTKIMNFVSRPKEAMAEMMMKQMMNQMGSKPGASPFPPGMPQGSPFGMPPTPPAYDTTAQPAQPPQATQPPPPVSPFAPAGSVTDTDPQKNGVNTPVSPPQQAAPPPPPPPPQSSFFQDVKPEATQAETVGEEDTDEAVDFMFEMLKNPQMRESLYQFLPENMRNPEMLETVMASPMVKEQFKSMMTPELLQQIKGFQGQMGNADMKSQLESMNVSPDVLMQKLMGEPEIVAMMQKPNVMQAVMDLQQNPGNMSKYMNDPEVMQFMMKMNELTLQAQMRTQDQGTPPPPAAPAPPAPTAESVSPATPTMDPPAAPSVDPPAAPTVESVTPEPSPEPASTKESS